MAIMEGTALEPSTAPAPAEAPARLRDRLKPHWRTSPVPWVVAGGLALAAVATTLAVWSIDAGSSSPAQVPGSIAQYCLDMGGTASQCDDLTLPQSNVNVGSDVSDSIAS